MPIQIEISEFTDAFGNVLPYYKSNAGDKFTANFRVRSAIRLTSLTAPLTLDGTLQQISSPVVSWLDEGFRVGDWVKITKHASVGPTMSTAWRQINYVDDVIADFSSVPFWYNTQNGQYLVFLAVTGNGSSTPRGRDDLDVLLNHSPNTQTGSEFSLIDGEATRATFQNVAAMLVGATINGNLVGNQSGQFLESADITRLANNSDGFRVHDITVTFTQSGAYNSEWFDSSNCLKVYLRLEWASVSAEPFARSIVIYNNQANSGFFNDANNTSVTNATLTQGVASLDFGTPSTFDIIVDGPTSEIGIGALYISTDTNYYKNRTFPQQNITMLLPTTLAAVGVYNSELNEFGAGYSIEINSITPVGSVTTINVTFTPNAAFTSFMQGVEDGNRLFYLWAKCGNLNLSAFSGQLTIEPPIGGPLTMEQDFGYLDHSENVETATGDNTGFIADTEDDVAYLGAFLLEKNKVYDSFSIELEAFEVTTLESFTLQSVFFSFAGVQISNDGRYLLNELASVVNTLPATSAKINARLFLEPSLDTATHYGVKIYCPWLLNWKYWLQKQDANVDFYPNQNQNWEQYDNLPDWTIRTLLTLIDNGLAYTHANTLEVAPYNNEATINSTIEIFDEATLNPITAIPTNTLVRIKSTHTKTAGTWDQLTTWGMITIEPHEAERRWICSSAINLDNNINNPLTPLSGLNINISFPSPDKAVLECVLDSSKIDLSNGVDIGAKIKEKDVDVSGFLLTEIKEAALGFSVMKISPDSVWSGRIIRIRRSSDNSEQDFNAVFNGTNWILDTAAVLAFTGGVVGRHAWVTDWEDQSAEGKTATQSVLADQPQIVRDGAIITDPANGFPALDFDGVNQYFNIPLIAAAPNFCQAFQFRRISAGTFPAKYSIGVASNLTYPAPFIWTIGILYDFMGQNSGTNNVHATGQTSAGSFLNLVYEDFSMAPNEIKMRHNGIQKITINEALSAGGSFDKVGKYGLAFHEGLMQELVLYSNQVANIAFVEGNINFRFQTF